MFLEQKLVIWMVSWGTNNWLRGFKKQNFSGAAAVSFLDKIRIKNTNCLIKRKIFSLKFVLLPPLTREAENAYVLIKKKIWTILKHIPVPGKYHAAFNFLFCGTKHDHVLQFLQDKGRDQRPTYISTLPLTVMRRRYLGRNLIFRPPPM